MNEMTGLGFDNSYADAPEAICNIEAEQAVLGAMLLEKECLWLVDGLKPEQFYEPLHGRIFEAIAEVVRRGGVADQVTLKSRFADDQAMAEVGGIGYLAALAGASISLMAVPSYAQQIAKLAQRRHMAKAALTLADLAKDGELDSEEMLAQAETALAGVADDSGRHDNIQFIGEAVSDALKKASKAARCDGGFIGTRTGLDRLDRVTGGFRDGHLVIVGARPGQGKSSFMISAAIEGAQLADEKSGVGIISLEMSNSELAARAVSQIGHRQGMLLTYDDLTKGLHTADQMDGIEAADRHLRTLPIQFDDVNWQTVTQIKATARKMDRAFKKQGRRLTAIFIDYLQIVRPDKDYRGNTTAEVTKISKDLKAMARQLDIPVIVFSQLNRQVENRESKRPMLSDLRDSGSLEQDADLVLFLVRPAYYLDRDKPDEDDPKHAEWLAQWGPKRHRLDLTIAKNRHGPCADIRLHTEIEFNVICDNRPSLVLDQLDFEGSASNG